MKVPLLVVALTAASGIGAWRQASPELFGEGVVSTQDYELNAAFSPDGKTIWFTKSSADMRFWTIVSSKLVDGKWTEPEVAPFSGRFSDADLCVSPDGKRMAFISRRPIPATPGRPVPHIWYVDSTPSGWSQPRNAATLNSEAGEYYPSIAADGTLYFESARPGGLGRADVYRARLVNGEYAQPERLGAPLNSEFNEGDAVIAPDQSFLILNISGRPDDMGMGDLYISEQKDGAWSSPRHLPAGINSPALEFCPSLSPGGESLYFTSTRGLLGESPDRPRTYGELIGRLRSVMNGLGNVYRVPMEAVGPRGGD